VIPCRIKHLARLENISVKENQLSAEFADLQVLKQHYNNVLKQELPKEEEKQTSKKVIKIFIFIQKY
jgi:predicted nucleotidyltransferase